MQDETTVEPDAAGVPVADRILHSDPHDFAGLYIRHRASFTLHARRYLRDARDADEVVQEAFLRLFLALPELDTELQALAYCRRTITNLCIDRFRAQARRPTLVDLDSAGAMDLADDDPGDPVVRAEDAAMVRAALSLLSPLHRAALVKREIEEKTLPVIAQELEIPEESVKHVLFRARRALRRILAATSLAPGSDAEIAGALGKAMRAGSSGVAAFVMLLVLSLGTGPDLRAIPVVGTDLPDLIPVTGLVEAVGDAAVAVGGAVSTVAEGVASAVTSGGDGAPGTEPSDVDANVDPAPAPAPTASPSASPEPLGAPSASPSGGPEAPAASAAPSAAPAEEPSTAPQPQPQPSREASEPSSEPAPQQSEPAPKPSSGGSASPSRSASSSPNGERKNPKPVPSPEPYVAGGDDPEFIEWEESDATYVEVYNSDGTPGL